MGLHANGYRLGFSPFRHVGGALISIYGSRAPRDMGQLAGRMRGIAWLTEDNAALPSGALAPSAWMLPQKPGAMASRNDAVVSVSATAVAVGGVTTTASATLSISAAATGALIALGSGSASISVSSNTPSLTSPLNGSGTATVAISTNTPILGALASVEGAASLAITAAATAYPLDDTPPARTASATLSISGSLEPYAIGHMAGTTVQGLTPDGIAAAVWNALANTAADPATMGGKLNAAGGAADPWATELPGAYGAGTAGALFGALDERMQLVRAILRNKQVTDPGTGVMTIYADDGVTPLLTANLWENAAATQPYRGQGAELREALQ